MKQLPLVSILVPIYGVEKYIEKCARTLFAQSYSNIEYVFVNDCTKDNSIEILQNVINEFPIRKNFIKIINHKINKGLSAARETALKNCTGDYIWHIDSDDWLADDAVLKLVQKAISENFDILGFNIIEETSKKSILRKHSKIKSPDVLAKKQLLRLEKFEIWSYFIKKSLFENVIFDTKIGFGEDWALTTRVISNANKLGYIDDFCYYYNRLNINSYTANINNKSIDSIIRAYNVLADFFIWKGDKFYIEVLNGAKQNLYIHLLKMVASNDIQFERIWSELLKIDFSDIKYIQSFNKPIAWCVKFNFKLILQIYIKVLSKVVKLLNR